ncbi:MAG: aminotransferase class I/II-fold pyridoxal phosphate-dependent enzyme [Flavobacteriaceae bacterium]|nr:aminotransferase class I/II-fold pyridoxal phosphate-dependent enzyme [Flavobacteriaceae bacterium]
MRLNKHIVSLKPSATLQINENVKALRNKGKKISHFGFGQSPFPIFPSITEALKAHVGNNHYLPVNGLASLRKEISKFLKTYQKVVVESESIYIGPGSKELLYQSILIFEGHFLIPKGSWVSYIPQIKSKGGSYSILETTFKNDIKLTAEALEDFLLKSEHTEHILILNSPNNPTGAVYTDKEYENLAIICRKYNVIVLSDEIYSQINFTAGHSASISNYYPEKTIVFGGLSKVFSAGGYRLGFMALPKEMGELSKVYRSLFSETFSCVSSPIQLAAITAYEYNYDLVEYVNDSSLILKGVSNYIFENLTHNKISCTKPQGAFYMMIGFDQFQEQINKLGIETSQELSHYLLEKYQVALLPASDFGFENEELFFRLAFVDFDGKKVMEAYQENGSVDSTFIEQNCSSVYRGVQQLIDFTVALGN